MKVTKELYVFAGLFTLFLCSSAYAEKDAVPAKKDALIVRGSLEPLTLTNILYDLSGAPKLFLGFEKGKFSFLFGITALHGSVYEKYMTESYDDQQFQNAQPHDDSNSITRITPAVALNYSFDEKFVAEFTPYTSLAISKTFLINSEGDDLNFSPIIFSGGLGTEYFITEALSFGLEGGIKIFHTSYKEGSNEGSLTLTELFYSTLNITNRF